MKQGDGRIFRPIGKISQILSSTLVIIDLWDSLAVGEVVRLPLTILGTYQEQCISKLTKEEGGTIYKAEAGQKVLFSPQAPVQPKDVVEKLQIEDCFRVEAIISTQDICYLNGVVEGYDGLALLRTIDSSSGLVELLISPSFQDDVRLILEALQREMPFRLLSEKMVTDP